MTEFSESAPMKAHSEASRKSAADWAANTAHLMVLKTAVNWAANCREVKCGGCNIVNEGNQRDKYV